MDRWRVARNVAIILVLAALVRWLPAGGRVASAFEAALWAGFAVGIAYIGLRLYREHRISVLSLGDWHRGLLYGGIAMAVFLWASRTRLWLTGAGELLWFALLGFTVYAFLEVFRHSRSY